jgi:hypothetical protein
MEKVSRHDIFKKKKKPHWKNPDLVFQYLVWSLPHKGCFHLYRFLFNKNQKNVVPPGLQSCIILKYLT